MLLCTAKDIHNTILCCKPNKTQLNPQWNIFLPFPHAAHKSRATIFYLSQTHFQIFQFKNAQNNGQYPLHYILINQLSAAAVCELGCGKLAWNCMFFTREFFYTGHARPWDFSTRMFFTTEPLTGPWGRGRYKWWLFSTRISTAECLHGPCFLPLFFLHACFFTKQFFYRVHFSSGPSTHWQFFFILARCTYLYNVLTLYLYDVYLHNARFSPSPWVNFLHVVFYKCPFYRAHFFSSPLPTGSFLHLSFNSTYVFSPLPWVFSHGKFTNEFPIERNNSSGPSIYWHFVHSKFTQHAVFTLTLGVVYT